MMTNQLLNGKSNTWTLSRGGVAIGPVYGTFGKGGDMAEMKLHHMSQRGMRGFLGYWQCCVLPEAFTGLGPCTPTL